MKTILLENDELLSTETDNWMKSIDINYKMVNSSVREYTRRKDLYFFAMLIDPKLERICTSSAFLRTMDYAAMLSFGKVDDNASLEEQMEAVFPQLEYFMWLIREAVWYRSGKQLPKLSIHVNYQNESDFVSDVMEGEFGEETASLLRLTLRQFDNDFELNVYRDYKLIKTLKNEEDIQLIP